MDFKYFFISTSETLSKKIQFDLKISSFDLEVKYYAYSLKNTHTALKIEF